jgi:hypothetical protein
MKQLSYCDSQISGAIVQNSVATTIWRPGFVHPWFGAFSVSLPVGQIMLYLSRYTLNLEGSENVEARVEVD